MKMQTIKSISREIEKKKIELQELRKEKLRLINKQLKLEASKRFCMFCKKKLTGQRRKFCSNLCHSRYRYKLLKDDPEFKKRTKARYQKWRKKNRKHVNAIILPKVKKWNKKRYWYRRKLNLCTGCGKKLKDITKAECPNCRAQARKYSRRWNRKHG